MSKDEDDELNGLLASEKKPDVPPPTGKVAGKSLQAAAVEKDDSEEEEDDGQPTQYSRSGHKYIPAGRCVPVLEPGLYEICSSQSLGLYFENIGCDVKDILKFPDTNSAEVLNSITTFWEREDLFDRYGLPFKRGILLWGPPGSGKTCTIKLLIKDVIERKGIIFKFDHPSLFITGLRIFRTIQPTTPVVVLMEDIDAILEQHNESSVINILDGVDVVNKIVFLATTNYPEKLGARIINRPSRFDRRYKINVPNAASRKMYFEHLIKHDDIVNLKIDLKQWVKDTNNMSIAHLKELFVGVCILGDDYKFVLKKLKSMMHQTLSSGEDDATNGNIGFGAVNEEEIEDEGDLGDKDA